MKKTILLFVLCLFGLQSFAQKQIIPDELGAVAVLNEDSTITTLDVESALVKIKTLPLPVVGMLTKHKTIISLKGATAPVSFASGKRQFVVKVSNNQKACSSIVFVTKFDVKKKERNYLISEGSLFQGTSVSTDFNNIKWRGERLGDEAFLITVDSMEPGEYGIWVFDQEVIQGSNYRVATFTIK